MRNDSTVLVFGVMAAVMLSAASAGANEVICPRLALSSVEKPDLYDAAQYSATETTDLLVHVVLPDAFKEDHVISLKFITPAGHLYRQIDVPVTSDIGRDGPAQTRKLPGYPYPVKVAVPEVRRVAGETATAIEVHFPVGGTSIVSSSLFGVWRVEGMLDGRELRCIRPLTVVIEQ